MGPEAPTLEQEPTGLSRPPTQGEILRDRLFRALTFGFAWLIILTVVLIIWQIATAAAPTVAEHGAKPLLDTKWDGKERFGILPQIWGTLYSSILGVFLGTIFGVAVAIFLTQDFLPPKFAVGLKNVIELLAAIPSVVYGLWGIFVVIPAIRPACNWLYENLGWIPFFDTRLVGPGMLPAALVLAIMVLPTVTAISRDSLAAVPNRIREAAYGLGATRWEAILGVIVPTASRGIYGSIILAFGRALGETMALAMLVGNARQMDWSMFSPGDTLAAMLANKFPEASSLEVGALMYAALVLLAITLTVNLIGTLIIRKTSVSFTGGAK
jgi:phosphate transport system permease protein